MKVAPSQNPEKESKNLSVIALALGIGSLIFWPLGTAGLALGVRAAILSKRVSSTKHLIFSIIGTALSLVSLIYYYNQ